MGCMKLFNSCFKAILFITWKKVIRFFITAIISLACLAFVLHQTYECIQEYFRYPQSTQISYDSKKNHIQPVITICPKNQLVFEEVFYKKSVLQDCNLSSGGYTKTSQWSSFKCPNPAEVYESIMPSFTSWFKEIELEFLETPDWIKISADQHDAWQPVEKADVLGPHFVPLKCYTLKQSTIEKLGHIKTAAFSFRKKGTIFITSPGQFQAVAQNQITGTSTADLQVAMSLKVAYEEHQTLVDVIHKKPCNNGPGYSFDQCILDEIEKESLETIGCTTMIHSNKTNMCRDASKARMAVDLLDTYKRVYYGNCSRPCNFISSFRLTISEMSDDPTASGYKVIHFEDDIKVFKSGYTYSFLSLVAEIGGHVGLFLGVAVVQLSKVIIYFLRKCNPKF